VVEGNLAESDTPRAIVVAALDAFGRIDLLVNNAGMYDTTPLELLTPEKWDETFAVNLRSMFFLCQAAASALKESDRASIVNLASDGGISPRPGFPVSAAYATSKAGVIMLTRYLALELAPLIRVNAVAPGVIDSKRRPDVDWGARTI
jgi:NAD(P)-dependent dehydrogenase (short-subunit alcohol dehydrogenase family)